VNDRNVTNISGTRYTSEGLLSTRFGVIREQVRKIVEKRGTDTIKDAVYINGEPYREAEKRVKENRLVFNDGKYLDIYNDAIESEIVVPTNSFFMLGDNSARSSDSRYWGFAGVENLKGRAWVVYLPIKRIKKIR
jgi:signal peptidase I